MQTTHANDCRCAKGSAPTCPAIWGARVCAHDSWGQTVSCASDLVFAPMFLRLQTTVRMCAAFTKPKKELPKIVSLWLVRVPRAAACKRKIVSLPTVPCPGGFCLLPESKRKQRVGELIGVFGSSLPGCQVACAFGQRLASAQRYAAGSHPFPLTHGLSLRPQSSRSLPRSPSARAS